MKEEKKPQITQITQILRCRTIAYRFILTLKPMLDRMK